MLTSSDLLGRLRLTDPDRFFCTLFVPASRRDTITLLYLFNHELARARTVARTPIIALIRLQWWREVVQGAVRQHDVAVPLSAALQAGLLAPVDLLALIAAREVEADAEIADFAAFLAYARGTAGRLAWMAGKVLGVDSQAIEDLGTAYGISGILRSVPFLRQQNRSLLPADGTTEAQIIAAARKLLSATPPRTAIAAVLPAVYARRDLGKPFRRRGVTDQLAVLVAALSKRI